MIIDYKGKRMAIKVDPVEYRPNEKRIVVGIYRKFREYRSRVIIIPIVQTPDTIIEYLKQIVNLRFCA